MEENQTLDQLDKVKKDRFAKLALMSWAGAIVFLIVSMSLAVSDSDGSLNMIFGLTSVFGFIVLAIASIVLSIISFVKKETNTVLQVIAILLSSLLFLILLGLLAFMFRDMLLFSGQVAN